MSILISIAIAVVARRSVERKEARQKQIQDAENKVLSDRMNASFETQHAILAQLGGEDLESNDFTIGRLTEKLHHKPEELRYSSGFIRNTSSVGWACDALSGEVPPRIEACPIVAILFPSNDHTPGPRNLVGFYVQSSSSKTGAENRYGGSIFGVHLGDSVSSAELLLQAHGFKRVSRDHDFEHASLAQKLFYIDDGESVETYASRGSWDVFIYPEPTSKLVKMIEIRNRNFLLESSP